MIMELSTEEKAKRFDEVLAMAKDCITYIPDDAINQYMLDMFPELKESDDEKIRKAIIEFFELQDDNTTYSFVPKKKILAWLEKQCDSPIKWNKNTEGNKPQVNHSVLMQTAHGIAEGEWKGEQWYQYRWSSIIKDSDVLSWIELREIAFNMIDSLNPQSKLKPSEELKKIEQKTIWNEDDEKKIRDVIRLIEQGATVQSIRDHYTNWLKSLKDRIQPK